MGAVSGGPTAVRGRRTTTAGLYRLTGRPRTTGVVTGFSLSLRVHPTLPRRPEDGRVRDVSSLSYPRSSGGSGRGRSGRGQVGRNVFPLPPDLSCSWKRFHSNVQSRPVPHLGYENPRTRPRKGTLTQGHTPPSPVSYRWGTTPSR